MKILISTAAAVGSVLLLTCAATHAATFNIADGDVASLVSALKTAKSNNDDDVINLAPKGTYTLTTVDNSESGEGPNGLPAIASDGGHSLTINGNGATIARSSAQGTPAFRFLHISGATVNISGVTLSNGLLNMDAHAGSGAGILIDSGAVALSNCSFLGNVVSGISGGGAIEMLSGTLTVTNCLLRNNSASAAASVDGTGGAIESGGKVTVSNSTFDGNTAKDFGGP